MAIERMPITPSVLTWARERAGYTIGELINSTLLSRILDWETGWDAPTYQELEKVADQLEVPVAVFFFPEPPKLPLLERTFRTLGSSVFYDFSPRIQFLMQKAQYQQQRCAELRDLMQHGESLIVNDLRFSVGDTPEQLGRVVRDYLDISIDVQFKWARQFKVFENWRRALFAVGVSVLELEFRQDDYLGFALYDKRFPIICVNRAIQWREGLLTVFHSLTHLLFQTSGVDKRDDRFLNQLTPENRQIEEMCNKLSPQIVVPHDELAREFISRRDSGTVADNTSELAYLFGVQEKWLNKRLLTLNLIAEGEYQETLDTWAARPAIGGGGGGHRFSAIFAELGVPYIKLAHECFDADLIDEGSLTDYIGTAPQYFAELRHTIELETI